MPRLKINSLLKRDISHQNLATCVLPFVCITWTEYKDAKALMFQMFRSCLLKAIKSMLLAESVYLKLQDSLLLSLLYKLRYTLYDIVKYLEIRYDCLLSN